MVVPCSFKLNQIEQNVKEFLCLKQMYIWSKRKSDLQLSDTASFKIIKIYYLGNEFLVSDQLEYIKYGPSVFEKCPN